MEVLGEASDENTGLGKKKVDDDVDDALAGFIEVKFDVNSTDPDLFDFGEL